MKYNYIDLFHGIGGFALGAYWAGMKFENHFCSDIEPYAKELYKLRFPDSIQLEDISKIDTEKLKNKYGDDWILTGGFPCQDISIAGKGEGIHGKRSGLWFEYWRLIRDLQPRFAIMENVRVLVHRGLRKVLGSLAEIGYDAEWQNISAKFVGLPQNRERIWIVAYPSKFRFNDKNKEKKIIKKILPKWSPRQIDLQGPIKRIIDECDFEYLPGGDGISGDVDEIKGLGNAIVPQIAELLFNQIKDYL